MSTLIFVRHGETPWSRSQEFRFRGRIDIPLTERGELQAKAVAEHLKDKRLTAIYTSPLKRARDTAIEIAKFHNLPVINHQGFIDLNFGTWEGVLHEELKRVQPKKYNRWLNEPHTMDFADGESLDIVRNRIEDAIAELVNKHENETIVIATHGAVLRVILCFLHNVGNENYWKYNMDNCAITTVSYEDGKYSILTENENDHLKEID